MLKKMAVSKSSGVRTGTLRTGTVFVIENSLEVKGKRKMTKCHS
jgi:hypothetical protein